MKISIIVPLYNCESYIANCIESIQSQSYENWELIIVDDQSKDNGYEVCSSYAKNDDRIQVIKQNNAGSGVARNKGIDLSTGEYLMFCDADDFLLPHSLELLVQEIIESRVDLVIGGYKEFKYKDNEVIICGQNKPKTEIIKGQQNVRSRYIELFDNALIQAPWAKLYKTKIVKQHNVRFANYRRCQDTVFNISYYEYISSVAIITNPVYIYQTPDGDAYIRKFPVDMIDIRLSIDKLLKDKLNEWNCFNEQANQILSKVLMIDTLVCCRLNFMNNWSSNEEDHKIYISNLVSIPRIQEVLAGRHYGIIRNFLCRILKTKNYNLIKFVNKILIYYINHK